MIRYIIKREKDGRTEYLSLFMKTGENEYKIEFTTDPNRGMLYNEDEIALIPISLGTPVKIKI